MRPLEIFVVVFVFLALVALLIPSLRHKKIRLFSAILVMFAIVAHLWVEGSRWHMAPVYLLVVFLCGVGLRQHIRAGRKGSDAGVSSGSKLRTVLFASFALLLLGGGVVLMMIFPVVNLPEPTGPYAVGTSYLEYADSNRAETLTDDPNDIREFEARVWYPAEPVSGADPLPYLEYSASVGSLSPGSPAIAFTHLDLSRSNSYLDAPVSSGAEVYPVLLLSVGFLAGYEDHQLSAEELASHGYVVFSVTNPYESASVVKDDGTEVPFSAEHREKYDQHMETIMPFWMEFWGSDDTTVTNEIARQILVSEDFMDNVLRIRVADLRFVVNELERMNMAGTGGILSGKLDLSRLGVLGHSMGGAVAGQLCLADERVKAGVNLDGYQWGDVAEGTITQPFLTAYSEAFEGANDFILGNFANETFVFTIDGSTHMNFSDWPFVLPITNRMGMAGPIEPARAATIVNDYLLAFFDKHLKGGDPQLLSRSDSPYPEVRIAVRTP